jgi:3-oxoacyl-[acyl-carrier-protein] synthase-1
MYITSTGMVCSVGLNAAAACAAIRAGIANFVELPYRDNQGEPIIGAMVPGIPRDLKRDELVVELLVRALSDSLRHKQSEPLKNIPILIGLAETDRPGGRAGLAHSIINRVEEKLGWQFQPRLSGVITQGHTSGFRALQTARKLFHDGQAQTCIICGVDSYINASSLLWLDQFWRLKTEENSDGVIPGEAAAAVLLEQQTQAQSECKVKVIGLGFSHESAHVLSEDPLLGQGLAEATRTALAEAGCQMHEIDFRISDVTGESYGFKEQALVLSRLMRSRREELPIWHCADTIGDSGAASGICQLVIAQAAFTKGYAPGNQALCYTSSVPGDRATAVLRQITD